MPEALTEANLLSALSGVKDPDLGRSIVEMGMIKEIKIEDGGGKLAFTCELTTPACPVKEVIEKDVRDTVARAFPQLKAFELKMSAKVRGAESPAGSGENLLPQIKNVVMVGSGRGGVGKSTLSVNIALALQRLGARVCVLDLDIYGPSLPLLMGQQQKPKLQGETKICPVIAHGMEIMSMGFLVEPRQAMVWRGQILNGIITQFLRDVLWSAADYMLVDLAPGPAEVALTLAQSCPSAGAVLVTTPQELSLAEIFRAKALFDQLRVPVLGLVENMSGFYCPECRKPHDLFRGAGAGRRVAEEMRIPLLGEIPIEPSIGSGESVGVPIVLGKPESAAAKAFVAAAEKLAAQVSIRNHARAPTAVETGAN